MATRATIYVDGIDTVKVYKHWDGHPDATLQWLEDFNKEYVQARGFDDPTYKFAQLLRSSIRDAKKYSLDDAHFTGWGVVGINDDCGAEWEYYLNADGSVTHLAVERHYEYQNS